MNGGRVITCNVGSLPVGVQTAIPNQTPGKPVPLSLRDVAFDRGTSVPRSRFVCARVKSGVSRIRGKFFHGQGRSPTSLENLVVDLSPCVLTDDNVTVTRRETSTLAAK